jgi:hypothetical protein
MSIRECKQFRLQTRHGILLQGWMTEEQAQEIAKKAQERMRLPVSVAEVKCAVLLQNS